MMEVIIVFDCEYQQNFKNVILTKAIQNYHKEISRNFVEINELVFMFDEEPYLDKPKSDHLCIFYKRMDYNLTELYNLLIREKISLEEGLLHRMTI